MAATDLINAVIMIMFINGYFKRARWRFWLGTLTLTISMYAVIVFNYTTIASGAWQGNLAEYVWLNVAFILVILLFVLMGVWTVFGITIEWI